MANTTDFKYIIIGGGVSGSFTGKELRKLDETGSILILGQEDYGPYKRPPLTKDLWDGRVELDDIFYKINSDDSVDIRTNTKVTTVNADEKTVITQSGDAFGYEKLFLATGGTPNKLDGPASERVIAYRTLNDYKQLQNLLEDAKDAIVIGGGFIGAELAASVSEQNITTTLIYPDNLLGEKKFPEEIAEEYTQAFKDHDVQLVNNSRAASYDVADDRVTVETESGDSFEADVLIFGLGIKPNVELAEGAGLEVDNGVVVNEYFQTSNPDIYAVGDIANYNDVVQGRTRVEHEDQARQSGKNAANNAIGDTEAYEKIPLFYSDLYDIEYEAYGVLDASLTTIIEPLEDGKLVYYLDGDEPKGFLNWNIYTNRSKIRSFLKEDTVDVEKVKGTVTK